MNFLHSRYYTLDLDEIDICVDCIEAYIREHYATSSYQIEKVEIEFLLKKLKAVLNNKDGD